MEIDRTIDQLLALLLLIASGLHGCASVKEVTAPCRRPANLAAFADENGSQCGSVRPVNDPAQVFEAIGIPDLR